ncbi:MAG: serine/threonine-protein kinase [Pirellulaceae bacterium]
MTSEQRKSSCPDEVSVETKQISPSTDSESDFANDEKIQVAVSFISSVKQLMRQVEYPSTPRNDLGISEATIREGAWPSAQKNVLPKQIGRFPVLRMLGVGGFSRVYLARDELLNRNVALKVLSATSEFPESVIARFEREAKAAALLSHPNIVPIFETGSDGDYHFISAAYVPGITLARYLKDYPNGLAEYSLAAKCISTLAEAVEHAHQRGILHRDLKPSNILVELAETQLDVEPGVSTDSSVDNASNRN